MSSGSDGAMNTVQRVLGLLDDEEVENIESLMEKDGAIEITWKDGATTTYNLLGQIIVSSVDEDWDMLDDGDREGCLALVPYVDHLAQYSSGNNSHILQGREAFDIDTQPTGRGHDGRMLLEWRSSDDALPEEAVGVNTSALGQPIVLTRELAVSMINAFADNDISSFNLASLTGEIPEIYALRYESFSQRRLDVVESTMSNLVLGHLFRTNPLEALGTLMAAIQNIREMGGDPAEVLGRARGIGMIYNGDQEVVELDTADGHALVHHPVLTLGQALIIMEDFLNGRRTDLGEEMERYVGVVPHAYNQMMGVFLDASEMFVNQVLDSQLSNLFATGDLAAIGMVMAAMQATHDRGGNPSLVAFHAMRFYDQQAAPNLPMTVSNAQMSPEEWFLCVSSRLPASNAIAGSENSQLIDNIDDMLPLVAGNEGGFVVLDDPVNDTDATIRSDGETGWSLSGVGSLFGSYFGGGASS